jgi:molybdopterin synthase sulfur carrier subunit
MRRLSLGSRHRPLSMSKTMKVTIKLYSILAKHLCEDVLNQQPNGFRAGSPIEFMMPSGSTLGDLVDSLSLPEDLVKITFVNGIQQELNYQLQPGDQVGMFPAIAGG